MRKPTSFAEVILKSLIFLSLSVATLTFGQSSFDCTTYESTQLGKKVRYCVHQTDVDNRVDNQPVIYFFHGMGGGAGSWQDSGYLAALDRLRQEKGGMPVTAISFDTDANSFFSDWGGADQGRYSYETWFRNEFVPMMEKEHGVCREKSCRLAVGVSMGGFGAIKTALKNEAKLFSAVAANCPALSPFEVHDATEKWVAYFNKHPIGAAGMQILGLLRRIFPTPELANANDPAILVKNWNTQLEFPALYFDVGTKDFFGLQEGHEVLKKALEEKHLTFTSHIEPNADHDIYLKRNIDAIRFVLDAYKAQKAQQSN